MYLAADSFIEVRQIVEAFHEFPLEFMLPVFLLFICQLIVLVYYIKRTAFGWVLTTAFLSFCVVRDILLIFLPEIVFGTDMPEFNIRLISDAGATVLMMTGQMRSIFKIVKIEGDTIGDVVMLFFALILITLIPLIAQWHRIIACLVIYMAIRGLVSIWQDYKS